MRKLAVVIFLFAAIQISAQTVEKDYSQSRFEFGFFTGVSSENFNYLDKSFFVEARYKITPRWTMKVSVGSYTVLKEENSVETLLTPYYENSQLKLHSNTYYYKGFTYEIVPASIGMEYMLFGEKTIPFLIAELGVNSSHTRRVISYRQSNPDITPSSYERYPLSGDRSAANFYKGTSIRMAFGAGIKQVTAGFLNLDVRYLYQINTNLVNSHLVLVGVNLLK